MCVYGHLDVQPAALEDGWDSEPFTLVERDGKSSGLHTDEHCCNECGVPQLFQSCAIERGKESKNW